MSLVRYDAAVRGPWVPPIGLLERRPFIARNAVACLQEDWPDASRRFAIALHRYVRDAQLAFDLQAFDLCFGGHAVAGHRGVAVRAHGAKEEGYPRAHVAASHGNSLRNSDNLVNANFQ
ncbi:MAG TPA: hypothetical protein VGL29_11145 [Blastocatellia bacterium]